MGPTAAVGSKTCMLSARAVCSVISAKTVTSSLYLQAQPAISVWIFGKIALNESVQSMNVRIAMEILPQKSSKSSLLPRRLRLARIKYFIE